MAGISAFLYHQVRSLSLRLSVHPLVQLPLRVLLLHQLSYDLLDLLLDLLLDRHHVVLLQLGWRPLHQVLLQVLQG